MQNQHIPSRSGRRRSCLRQRIEQRHWSREHVLAWRSHLAHDEHALASELIDLHSDLRITQIPVSQPSLEHVCEISQRQAAGMNATQKWIAELSVVLDAEVPGELRLVEHVTVRTSSGPTM